jgi:hypothetical protein
MQSVRALFSVVLALTLVVGTSQSALSSESMQGELLGSHMVMHVMGAHSTMHGTCHKCINKAPCCAVCVSTPALLPVASKVIGVNTKLVLALLTEPQFKSSTLRPNPPPPKLGDLT